MPEPELILMDELLLTHKECTKCKCYKTFSEFNKEKYRKNGLRSECKECKNKIDRELYETLKQNKDLYAYRLNKKANNRIGLDSTRINSINRNKNIPSLKYDYAPDKNRARALLNYHIKQGNIIKKPCAICGKEIVDGHHEDYSKPLEVIWLCRKHHMELHRKFNTIRQQLGIPEHDRDL